MCSHPLHLRSLFLPSTHTLIHTGACTCPSHCSHPPTPEGKERGPKLLACESAPQACFCLAYRTLKTSFSLAGASPLQSGPFGTVPPSFVPFLASSCLAPKDIWVCESWVGSWACCLAEAVSSYLTITDLYLAFTFWLLKEFPLMLSLDAFPYAFITVTLLLFHCTGDLQRLEQSGWEKLHHSEHDREYRLCEC